VRCDRLAERLPGVVDGVALEPAAAAHLDGCLRCQADVARYRRLRRELAATRHLALQPPPDLLDALDDGLDAARWAPDGSDHRRRAAYLGGLAATAAAGVGGALVLAVRSRRLAG
jgi:hypothetical protein